MNTTKPQQSHTPGPWRADGDIIEAAVDPENSDSYWAPICVMDGGWAGGVDAANARLIAAAPALLDALIDAAAYLLNAVPEGHPVLARVDAAVAKATGVQS